MWGPQAAATPHRTEGSRQTFNVKYSLAPDQLIPLRESEGLEHRVLGSVTWTHRGPPRARILHPTVLAQTDQKVEVMAFITEAANAQTLLYNGKKCRV